MAQTVEKESLSSLKITLLNGGNIIGTGTGFVILSKSKPYLITNWHNFTNRNPWDLNWIDPKFPITPDEVHIKHHGVGGIGNMFGVIEKIRDSLGVPLYKEWKTNGSVVDVVALPLTQTGTDSIKMYPVNYNSTYENVYLKPADIITVVGFPLGQFSALDFPIWKSGTLASEPLMDQERKPIIWLDMLGFGGMSGSPAYYISDNIVTRDGSLVFGTRYSFFMGVFSHMKSDTHIGAIWKSIFLKPLFDNL